MELRSAETDSALVDSSTAASIDGRSHGSGAAEQLHEIAAQYRVGEPLGSGGFGTVYRAIQTSTGLEVAIKVLHRHADAETRVIANHVARFEREADLCASLEHPNIVRLLDRGHTPNEIYYAVYELVPGVTLRELLNREHYLSVERAVELMGQILDALAFAHQRGVVHRDLKPSNIMVVDTGESVHAKVLDFGISTLTLEARDTAFFNVTRSNELVGTPRYSSPEQLRGDVPTTKTDLYAWGLVFLECITGRPAVAGRTLADVYQTHLSPVEIVLPSALVGHPIGEFLRRVLRKNPRERADDAAALYAELRSLHVGDIVGIVEADDDLGETMTIATQLRAEQRQVTVLASSLRLVPSPSARIGADALDAILRDQLELCRDALGRYGGTVTGQLGDQCLAMFGFPSASDTDARRAVRTVLELAEEVRSRSARLSASQGLAIELRIGIHTGMVTVLQGQVPSGITITHAIGLAAAADANSMLVSPQSRRLLEPYAEFERGSAVAVNGVAQAIETAKLIGERRSEALSFRPGQASAASFIGRRAELQRLRELDGRAALLIGEAGIGKSRLVRELLVEIREQGRAVFECRCLAEHRNTALSPILPVLRRLIGLGEREGSIERLTSVLREHELDPARYLPIVCVWLGVPLPSGVEPPAIAPFRQRELLLATVVAVLSGLGHSAVLLVEDLHWADPTTLELLGQLFQSTSARKPLLLCTARPEFSAPSSWTESIDRLELDRLSPEDAEQLVVDSWTEGEPKREVVEMIVERADGVPLFLEELTRMVVEQGANDLRSIPITLRDSLVGRLDRLGDARGIAQVAAALGREFDAALLYASANVDEALVERALDKLVAARLIYRRRRVGGSSYVFRHALIQDAAYDGMPKDQRRRVHARIAEVLEQQFAGSPYASAAELARHHASAGAFEAAVRHGTAAAQARIDESSNAEAMALAAQVAEWVPELPAEQRIDAELRLSGITLQALMSTRGWASPEVRDLAERSRKLLPQSQAIEHTVSTLFGLYMHYHVAGERARCRAVAEELVEFADRIGDGGLRSVAATAKGVNFHAEGRFLDAEVWLEKARELYDPIRDQQQGSIYGMDCRTWASAQLALVQWGMGRTQRAFELAKQAIAWAREIEHIPSLGIALLYISQIHQMNGDKPSVRETTGELLAASATYGLPAFEGYGATIASWAAGDLQGVQHIIGILESINCNLILTYYGSFLVDIEADAGHVAEAIAHAERYLGKCAEMGEQMFEAELLRRRALLELRLPAPDRARAREWLTRARTLAREQGMYRFEAAAIVDQQREFPDHQAALAERLREIHQAIPDLRPADPAEVSP